MTWTFDVTKLTDPTVGQLMQVRSLVQDTLTDDQQIEDEQIMFCLLQYPTIKIPYLAAAATCDMIAFFYAREVQNSIGPLSESAQQRYEHYVALAQQLRVLSATNGKGILPGSMAGVPTGVPVLGGGGPTFLGTTSYSNPEGL